MAYNKRMSLKTKALTLDPDLDSRLESLRVSAREDPLRLSSLNAVHMPDDAGQYYQSLLRMLARIPENWGRWIGVSKGWYPLVTEVDQRLAQIMPDYEINQVKEKFGSLRYYWEPGIEPFERLHAKPEDSKELEQWLSQRQAWEQSPDGIAATEDFKERCQLAEQIVAEAEKASATICEECGAPGEIHKSNAFRVNTLCSNCKSD